MYQYDARYRPPAPYIAIRILNPETGNSIVVPAKLDTGASTTVLPVASVRNLRLLSEKNKTALGFNRKPVEVPVFTATIEVTGITFEDWPVFAVNRPDVLLGRDILNQFDITLRGKAQMFEMMAV